MSELLGKYTHWTGDVPDLYRGISDALARGEVRCSDLNPYSCITVCADANSVALCYIVGAAMRNNPLKSKLIKILFKGLYIIGKNTLPHLENKFVNVVTEILPVFSENRTKPINAFCEKNSVIKY
jgi:hypothetical protein